MNRLFSAIAALLLLGAAAEARQIDVFDHAAVMESLSSVHPRLRGRWLRDRGIEDPMLLPAGLSTDSGLSVVGRWSYGTAFDIDGRVTASDTLLAYARGSGVSLLDYDGQRAIPVSLLADINCAGLVSRVTLRDTLLFIGSASSFEVWDVSSPAAPHRLCQLALPLNDFAFDDSIACIIGADDTFRVYSIADPASPRPLGACRDSGYTAVLLDNYAYVGDRCGLYVIDIRTPSAPHRIGSWGGDVISLAARNAICYVTTGNPNQPEELNFHVLDVSSPATPVRIGGISGVGGYDIDLADSFAYLSGYYTGGHEFRILHIADSSNPVVLGSAATIAFNFGVWARPACGRAFVADEYGGLALIDITDPAQPQPDTVVLRAGSAEDIALDGGKAYVASQLAGMKVLDVTDPPRPEWVGDLTQAYRGITSFSVAARDSFAYVCWLSPFLRVVSVADPRNPVMVAACTTLNHPEAMVIRDSFLYVAQDYRLQVVNVARPREPRLVGSCVTQEDAEGLCLVETLAYMASYPAAIINVRNPTNPTIVGTIQRGVWNLSVRDTFAFVSSGGVIVYSVADPTQPRVLDSISLGPNTYWVEAVGTRLYTGNRDGIHVVDATDVHNMREVGFVATPYSVKRLHYSAPYVYAACWDAGVCIAESTAVAVDEPQVKQALGRRWLAAPNPVSDRLRLTYAGRPTRQVSVTIFDVAGRKVMSLGPTQTAAGPLTLDVTPLRSGVYYAEVVGDGGREAVRFTKR